MFAGEEAYTPLDRLPGHFVMLMVHSSTFFGITRITKALAKKNSSCYITLSHLLRKRRFSARRHWWLEKSRPSEVRSVQHRIADKALPSAG